MSSSDRGAAQHLQRPSEARAVGFAALRAAMVLLAVSAASDWLYAHLGRHATAATAIEGFVLTALPVMALLAPERAAALLLPRGRMTLVAAGFALAGAVDIGVQAHYAQVASSIVFCAALVCSPAWVVVTCVVSAAGFVFDLLAYGHSPSWTAAATGLPAVSNQLTNLALNAVVGIALVWMLRRSLAAAPAVLGEARHGGGARGVGITPALAAATAGTPPRDLPRPDPGAATAGLTRTERAVLRLLAEGYAPKQAAVELHVALSTVRSHIKAAKRKTGARTLEQLVALAAEASAVEAPAGDGA